MNRLSVTKVFRFDAAHRLPSHYGLCQNLHGHSYQLEATFEGQMKREPGKSDENMVIDFGIVSNIWRTTIKPIVDHQYLNLVLHQYYPEYRIVTTAETLCYFFMMLFTKHGLPVTQIRIWEQIGESCATLSYDPPPTIDQVNRDLLGSGVYLSRGMEIPKYDPHCTDYQ